MSIQNSCNDNKDVDFKKLAQLGNIRNVSNFEKLFALLATTAFQKLITTKAINEELLLAAEAALLKAQIPFDVSYSIGSQRLAPSAQLVIYITPIWNMTFVFEFGPGDTSYGGK
ncbi:hypothetical protein [Defluviitalea saccharophila]|uniref:Uncharacterized protein n=1 Tax=Defluviitalea saccharophila TaxID=879970 RepID=A0ABZ2Y9K2_9FIRM